MPAVLRARLYGTSLDTGPRTAPASPYLGPPSALLILTEPRSEIARTQAQQPNRDRPPSRQLNGGRMEIEIGVLGFA